MKWIVEKNDRFAKALDRFLDSVDDISDDQRMAKIALMKNYEEMTDYSYRLSLSSAKFVEHQSSALVLPNTGGSTGIMALYWVYLATEEDGQITVKTGDDPNFDLFLKMLNSSDIKTYDNRAEFEETGVARSADLLVVYGSDRTCQMLAMGRDVFKKTVLYGSKTSIAIIHDAENLNYTSFAKDLFTYDGLGCLSPSVVYVDDAKTFVEGIKSHIPMKFDMDKIAFNHQHQDKLSELAVVRGIGEEPKLSIGRGTLVVVEELGLGNITEDLEPLKGKISCVVSDREIPTDFLGATRFCKVGKAQTPPLSWKHDGTDSLFSLVDMIGVG